MARDRKVEPIKEQAEALPDLTPKQMGFVQAILSGMTASDAYRHAYNAQNMSTEAIWVASSRVKAATKVALWLSVARSQALVDTVITKESHTRELLRLAKAAESSGNYGAAAKCVELTGRVNALYVDQIKTDTGQADVLQALAIIGKTDPAFAMAMKEQLGLSESDISGGDNRSTETTH